MVVSGSVTGAPSDFLPALCHMSQTPKAAAATETPTTGPTMSPIGGPPALEPLSPPVPLSPPLPLPFSLLPSPVLLLSVTTGAKTDVVLGLPEAVSDEDVSGDDWDVLDVMLLLLLLLPVVVGFS